MAVLQLKKVKSGISSLWQSHNVTINKGKNKTPLSLSPCDSHKNYNSSCPPPTPSPSPKYCHAVWVQTHCVVNVNAPSKEFPRASGQTKRHVWDVRQRQHTTTSDHRLKRISGRPSHHGSESVQIKNDSKNKPHTHLYAMFKNGRKNIPNTYLCTKNNQPTKQTQNGKKEHTICVSSNPKQRHQEQNTCLSFLVQIKTTTERTNHTLIVFHESKFRME